MLSEGFLIIHGLEPDIDQERIMICELHGVFLHNAVKNLDFDVSGRVKYEAVVNCASFTIRTLSAAFDRVSVLPQ